MTVQLRAAAYAQSCEKNPASIAEQIVLVRHEAGALGYSISEQDVFVDDGHPNRTLARPAWTALEAAVLTRGSEGTPFGCVLVESPKRVLRSTPHQYATLCQQFAVAGVPILWVTNVDWASDVGSR